MTSSDDKPVFIPPEKSKNFLSGGEGSCIHGCYSFSHRELEGMSTEEKPEYVRREVRKAMSEKKKGDQINLS